MAVAVIVAAGRGERLGSGRPKALVTIAGKPMLQWSLQALAAVGAVRAIVVALPPQLTESPPLGEAISAVAGGATRSESVRAALAAAPPDDTVIVHDAARPLAQPELFERALVELERSGVDAVIAAAHVSDTVKEVAADGRTVVRTLDRARLWSVQTPQVFRRESLERVLAEASADRLASATDDAWLVEQAGGTVRVVTAPAENFKVTTPIDLHLAGLLLAERGTR